MTNAEIGSRIKYARDLKDATLEDIAKKVGVTKSTIQRYEAGKISAIKIPVVDAIAIALNVNPAWIVGKSDDMELPSQKIPKILQYYETLNDIGKHEATKRVEELTYIPQYTKKNEEDYLRVNAAHARTDIEPTDEDQAHDDAIMNDDSEWE
ncbi:helix-turn-helix transcriptional regulator [Sporofaciens sp. JLR.KK001]|jgi:transcriptional regulator with XRE-family HTH domain|uniref:helix-turn-helix domain-containing protein n=1 Tax=Sporofaciens sp. JLR.KK001 TaxID=3112621 RepID=UPI002FF2A418